MFNLLRVWVLSERQAQSMRAAAFPYVLMQNTKETERFIVCFFFMAFYGFSTSLITWNTCFGEETSFVDNWIGDKKNTCNQYTLIEFCHRIIDKQMDVKAILQYPFISDGFFSILCSAFALSLSQIELVEMQTFCLNVRPISQQPHVSQVVAQA